MLALLDKFGHRDFFRNYARLQIKDGFKECEVTDMRGYPHVYDLAEESNLRAVLDEVGNTLPNGLLEEQKARLSEVKVAGLPERNA